MTVHGFLLRTARGARTFTAVSAAGAALSFAAVAAAPAAQAAAGPGRATTSRILSAPGRHATPAVIRCKIYAVIRYPHPLDATGKLVCSGYVHRITIRITIYHGIRPVRSQAFSRTNTRILRRTIFTSCVSGRYHATVLGKVRTRSGRVLSGGAKTRTVTVHC